MRTKCRLPAVLVLASFSAAFDEFAFDHFIPYVPTPQPVVDRMLELAAVDENDYVIDLGSGDGRIVISAARDRGARGFGVDIDPRLVRLAMENAAKEGVGDRVSFAHQNLFDTSVEKATVLTLYLPEKVNLDLKPRLFDELQPGTRIVSHAFPMGEWRPDMHERMGKAELFLWIIPADVAGLWEIDSGGQEFTLHLDQQFQDIRGKATSPNRSILLHEPRLRGDEIAFSFAFGNTSLRFAGKVGGNRMEGHVETNGTQRPWRATRID